MSRSLMARLGEALGDTRLQGTRLAATCAMSLMGATGLMAQSAPAPTMPEANNAAPSDEDRAKEVLAAESGAPVKPHALQAASPDYSIVVCEAGCGSQGAHVVYKISRALVRSVAFDAKNTDRPVTKNAECQGGCSAILASATGGVASTRLPSDAGSWITAPGSATPSASAPALAPAALIKPTAAATPPVAPAPMASVAPQVPSLPTPQLLNGIDPSTALAPLPAPIPMALGVPSAPASPIAMDAAQREISAARGAANDAPPATASKPAPAASRDDWLARINRERAAAKAAPATDAPSPPKG